MNIENFYPGLINPSEYIPEISPSDVSIGYHIPLSKLGATTNVTTANQIMEVFSRLNTGMKAVEAGTLSLETFEKIPKQHFEEINRLAKLCGAEISWHIPLFVSESGGGSIELAGVEGDKFSERERKITENSLKEAIEKIYKAIGPNQPITIHPTSILPSNYLNEGEDMIINVANLATDSFAGVRVKDLLTKEEINQIQKEQLPAYTLQKLNEKSWRETMEKNIFHTRDLLHDTISFPKDYLNKINLELDSWAYRETGEIKEWEKLPEEIKSDLIKKNDRIKLLLFEKEKMESKQKMIEIFFNNIKENTKNIIEIANKAKLSEEERKILQDTMYNFNKIEEIKKKDITAAASLLVKINENLSKIQPKIYDFIENVAVEKSAETISNLALETYKKFGDKAPILSMENVFPGMAFSRAESLRFLIEKSREKFIEKLKNQGVNEKKAREIAEKIIGATWDIGHINLLKKYGKKPEEIKLEFEKIKPYIKNIHITDNFGFSDSHLPPGMGTIEPEIFKEIEELTKKGVKGTLEIPVLAISFGVSPYPYAFAALGTPLYTYGLAPYWNQLLWNFPSYFAGYGPIFPEKHFEIYGASFAGLPVEFGGETKGGFSQVPME
ncbi:MAG: hypothetical protein QXQ30_00565 [Candidatus Pacearchaeota archaeon]